MALIFPELHPLHIVCLVFHQKIYQLHNLHTLSVCCKALMAIHPTKKDGTLKSDKDLKYSIQRQHYVLKRMLIEDQITEKEYNDALKYDIKSHLLNRKKR